MTLSEEMEEMGMTISMMGAELLATKKELKGALAALEEAQQQRDYWANKEEEARWETAEYAEDLREAQQTIAQQRESLEQIDKACRKRSFNDCGDLRAVVYDIAYAALGGETQP